MDGNLMVWDRPECGLVMNMSAGKKHTELAILRSESGLIQMWRNIRYELDIIICVCHLNGQIATCVTVNTMVAIDVNIDGP